MKAIEAAIRANVRPSTMILGSDNRKKWSDVDVMLMHAYETYKSEQCGVCGSPIWLCRNEDFRLHVRVKEVTCYAKKALDFYDEDHRDERQPGVSTYPEFYTRDGDVPLVEFRKPYYEAVLKELAEAAEDQD